MKPPIDPIPSVEAGQHLDGLLDRALLGTASDAQLLALRTHAATCSACAALIALGPALASELALAGEDETRDRRTVALALSSSRIGARSRRARAGWALAAAAAMVGSFAAAQYLGVTSYFSKSAPENSVSKAPSPALPSTNLSVPYAPPEARKSELEAPPSQAEVAPIQPAPREVGNSGDSARELFASANQLRRSGQDQRAIDTFGHLQRAFPRSDEAALSYATLGSLLLQRGDAKAALVQFDRYIARGGPVLEEALAGRARALSGLGDNASEREAWRAVLARFPKSVHAPRARARLAELD